MSAESVSTASSAFELVCEAIHAATNVELDEPIRRDHSLIYDLAFDSLTISVLALELEDRVGQAVLLNRWIEGVNDPSELTVDSLCDYLRPTLESSLESSDVEA